MPTNNLFTPLTDAELDLLGAFLLDRNDEEEVEASDGGDEGILGISELDGFLTAIVSSPVTVMPSQWLPGMWGDFPPEWQTEKEFETIYSLLIRHMNCIATTLVESPADFEPMFHEREVDGKHYLVVDEWCEGYLRGMDLAEDEWLSGGRMMNILLTPIIAFTEAAGWPGHECQGEELENLQRAITPNVREIHAWWLARREEFKPGQSRQPRRREEPKVGRNDPCPCGSGRKYKQCCLQ